MTFVQPLKIGDFLCPSNLVLAPMAGITDTPVRILFLKGGEGGVLGGEGKAFGLK